MASTNKKMKSSKKRSSPASVIVLDFTDEDSSDEDLLAKEMVLFPSGKKRRVSDTRTAVPRSCPSSVSNFISERASLPVTSSSSTRRTIQREKKSFRSTSSSNDNDNDNDSDDGGGKVGACRDLQRKQWLANRSDLRICVKRERRSRTLSRKESYNDHNSNKEPEVIEILDDDDDEEEEDSPPARRTPAAAVAKDCPQPEMVASNNEDGDVKCVGTANEVRLPHMRQHCLDYRFDRNLEMSVNKKYCSLCYCYVCDIPAKDCKSWTSSDGGNNNRLENHCHANDTHLYSEYWKQKRELAKYIEPEKRGAKESTGKLKSGTGPFPPDDAVAVQDRNLTKCRKCGWYNRFFHRNFTHYRQLHPTGFLDWCMKCGRVASERDFGKVQSKPYQEQHDDVYLGRKTIPFRIVARDPRKMARYKDSWTQEGWTYDETEMREDLFRHRFGERPTAEMILASIPIVKEADMPKDGRFLTNMMSFSSRAAYAGSSYKLVEQQAYDKKRCGPCRNRFFYWNFELSEGDHHGDKSEYNLVLVSADETEGIMVEKPEDTVLLQQIAYFEAEGFCRRKWATSPTLEKTSLLSYDIAANWDSKTQTGMFSVRLYVQPNKAMKKNSAASFNKLLGVWYDVFPFKLSEISGRLTATNFNKDAEVSRRTLLAPSRFITSQEKRDAIDMMEENIDVALSSHNKIANDFRNALCFESTDEEKGLGGQCASRQGFANILQSYYLELLVEDVVKSSDDGLKWVDVALGAVSAHRSMRAPSTLLGRSREPQSYGRDNGFAYLRTCDQPLARTLKKACSSVFHGTQSLKGLINHCEDLGHPEIAPFDGLNVELLQFQRQSVQWAFERETMSGGIQSLLWPVLPRTSNCRKQKRIYFNPILEMFRTKKPHLVRGGFICEEMGLGKTVISLSLILVNPAPNIPASDSPVSSLDALEGSPWDKSLYGRTQAKNGANPKHGSIISRGTLVVCHVSLVGQWIEEARSKLKNPGLVYPYHGQGRKRDARLLAKNAIVVTTYDTLASDAIYHAQKGGASYIAPLAQIRWWRIICDESQSLKDENTGKSRAVMNLVADHKWLVSGTPVSTSLSDLKSQMKFLGLENVNEMFGKFANALNHIHDRSAKQGRVSHRPGSRDIKPDLSETRHFGHLVYLLRCIMIRHSQQQTYRGTGPPATTLMSLPPKTERTLEIEFTAAESKKYANLETAALNFYANFKRKSARTLSKYFLKIIQKLTPMRIACAGGRLPLDGVDASPEANNIAKEAEEESEEPEEGESKEGLELFEADDDDNGNENNENDNEEKKDKSKKKQQETKYSKFVFQSKFDKLLEELKYARDNDPSSKSLVFSQFSSSLEYLQQELPKHGFQFRTLSGDMPMTKRAKALHDFQHDPPTTIFLLSMRSGAVGINLTQANRVFLLEPCFNPALERQSVGRVHRLGQKRNVEVVRLVMKDSIETRMLEMLEKKYANRNENILGDSTEDALVGCMNTDKSTILGAEFDMLFGLRHATEDADSDGDGEDEDDAVRPETAMSLFGRKSVGALFRSGSIEKCNSEGSSDGARGEV